jgi:hypothetical protein
MSASVSVYLIQQYKYMDVNKTSPCHETKGATQGSNWRNFSKVMTMLWDRKSASKADILAKAVCGVPFLEEDYSNFILSKGGLDGVGDVCTTFAMHTINLVKDINIYIAACIRIPTYWDQLP